jgi:RNA polymerase sigma factor for flagellar operon FliA
VKHGQGSPQKKSGGDQWDVPRVSLRADAADPAGVVRQGGPGQAPPDDERERLILEHAPLVRAIAESLMRRLPSSVAIDDLLQDGFIGLMDAVLRNTKDNAGQRYRSYLSLRVRGAMLDGLRQNDPGSRSVRRAMRRVERAIHELGHANGRLPGEVEVARALAMPLEDYQRLLQEAHGYSVFSIEDFDDRNSTHEFLEWCAVTQSDPVAALERRELQGQLLIAISGLSVRENQVMTLLYVKGLPMRSVGERLSLSEGRISQIHAHAIARLRAICLGGGEGSPLLAPRRRRA